MSKDNIHETTGDESLDTWGQEPSASTLLSNPSGESGSSTTDDDWGVPTSQSDDPGAIDSGLPLPDYEESSHDDESEQEDRGAEPEKKKSKLKAYALAGGMGLFVFSVLGAGFMMTQGPSAPATAPVTPVAAAPADYELDSAADIAPAPVEVHEPAQEPSRSVIAPPAGLDLDMEPRIQERPIDHGSTLTSQDPSADVLNDLLGKTDMLAAALTQLKGDADARIERIDSGASQVKERVSSNDKRITELEGQVKELTDFIQAMKDKQTRSSSKPAAKKPAASKPAPKPESAPKPVAAKPSSTKPVVSAQPVTKPQAPAGVRGFSVVATYPSTTSPGVKPEKAWITNGEQLVQVVVGSVVNGAKVTGIQGTTVYTSHGVIRSPK